MFNKSSYHPWVWFLLVSAVESVALLFVWNYAIATPFKLTTLEFGHIFAILLGFRILFKDFVELISLRMLVKDLVDVQVFALQNGAQQFTSTTALLTAVINEREKES